MAKHLLALELAELLQIFNGGRVASQVQKNVLEGTGMSVRQHKTITVSLIKTIDCIEMRVLVGRVSG